MIGDHGASAAAASGIVDLGVTSAAVGCGLLRTVDTADAVFVQQIGDDRGGVAVPNDEAPVELTVEVGEAASQEPTSVGCCPRPQPLVDDEQRDDLVALVDRLAESAVVGQTKVTAEPDDPPLGLSHAAGGYSGALRAADRSNDASVGRVGRLHHRR